MTLGVNTIKETGNECVRIQFRKNFHLFPMK